eukprot:1149731-Pelagomonas_calceolata.AAC.10
MARGGTRKRGSRVDRGCAWRAACAAAGNPLCTRGSYSSSRVGSRRQGVGSRFASWHSRACPSCGYAGRPQPRRYCTCSAAAATGPCLTGSWMWSGARCMAAHPTTLSCPPFAWQPRPAVTPGVGLAAAAAAAAPAAGGWRARGRGGGDGRGVWLWIYTCRAWGPLAGGTKGRAETFEAWCDALCIALIVAGLDRAGAALIGEKKSSGMENFPYIN